MKRFLFLICVLFTFFNVAKSEISPMQIAVLKQNKVLFVKFRFGKPTDHFAGYVVRYKKERFLIPIAGKPCKIPIPTRTRNKDNI